MPILAAIAPRGLAIALPVIGFIGFIALKPAINKRALTAFAVIAALGALSLLWAHSFDETKRRLIKTLPILFGGIGIISIAPLIAKDLSRLVPYGLIVGLIITLLNLYGGSPIYNLVRAEEWPHPKNLSHLNRSVVALSLCAVPVGINLILKQHWNLVALVIFLMAAMLYQTHSQSAHFAILAATGAVTYTLYGQNKDNGWAPLACGIVVLMLTSPFFVQWVFEHFAEHARHTPWLKNGFAAERLEVWDFIALRALESPWIGHGMGATRGMEGFDTLMLYHKSNTILHPHNFALQIWIEFGLVGILIAGVGITLLLRALWTRKPCAIAPLTAVMAVASTGYGMWQGWWLGSILLAACLTFALYKSGD